MRHLSIHIVAFSVLLALPLAGAPLANSYAQGAGGDIVKHGFSPPVNGVGPKPVQREPAPPGLPGAQSTAPASGAGEADLPPTEALFDAINRGDMPSAKDAINRGADLSARNVLGMTPLDLSVDLARNDITFLLLSLRPQIGGSDSPGSVATKSASARMVATRPTRGKSADRLARANAQAQRQASAGTQQSPVRYAEVPAPAVPQVGFLGFGTAATP